MRTSSKRVLVIICGFICSGYLLVLAFSFFNQLQPLQTWVAGYPFVSKKEMPQGVEVLVENTPLLHSGTGAYYKGELVGVYGRFGDFLPVKAERNGVYAVDEEFAENSMRLIGAFGLISALVLLAILGWSLIGQRTLGKRLRYDNL